MRLLALDQQQINFRGSIYQLFWAETITGRRHRRSWTMLLPPPPAASNMVQPAVGSVAGSTFSSSAVLCPVPVASRFCFHLDCFLFRLLLLLFPVSKTSNGADTIVSHKRAKMFSRQNCAGQEERHRHQYTTRTLSHTPLYNVVSDT